MPGQGKIQKALQKATELRRSADPNSFNDDSLASRTLQREPIAHKVIAVPSKPYDKKRCSPNRILIDEKVRQQNAAAVASYRILRTRILQRTQSNNWSAIGITSPGSGEGKSVTALNLALAIARAEHSSVFLIDLDMRKPTICKYLGITPQIEINQYFEGNVSPKDILFSIGVDNLYIAGTRTSSVHASELLASNKVEILFDFIRKNSTNTLILVDLPPILTTDDALIMAPKVDASLLVLSEGKTRRDSTIKALDILADFEIVGILLNQSKTMLLDSYNT